MTNVGLLYYNEADDKPRNLFPTIDAQIERWKGGNKTCAFVMKSFKWEIIFAAKDEQDLLEWLDAFKQVQDQADKRKARATELKKDADDISAEKKKPTAGSTSSTASSSAGAKTGSGADAGAKYAWPKKVDATKKK